MSMYDTLIAYLPYPPTTWSLERCVCAPAGWPMLASTPRRCCSACWRQICAMPARAPCRRRWRGSTTCSSRGSLGETGWNHGKIHDVMGETWEKPWEKQKKTQPWVSQALGAKPRTEQGSGGWVWDKVRMTSGRDVTRMMGIGWGIIHKWPYENNLFQVSDLVNSNSAR